MNLFSRKAWQRRLRRGWPSCVGAASLGDAHPGGGTARSGAIAKRQAADAIARTIQFLLPTVPLAQVLPGADLAEVVMLPRLIRDHVWAMPEHELLTLGAIAKMTSPRLVVEFGTFRGGSTLAIAANMPGGRVVTVDLDPCQRQTHEHGLGIGLPEFEVGSLFQGTRYAAMIEQRFANTVTFEADDLVGCADLVFVDADHTYEFTRRDTATALSLVRPGGWILWHDYTWEPQHSECAGVTKAVNEFSAQHGDCFHVAGTRFAIHRVPAAALRKTA